MKTLEKSLQMNVCNLPFKWASSSRPTTVMVQETQQVGTGPAKNALSFSIILLHPVILVAGREEKKKKPYVDTALGSRGISGFV